MLTVLLRRSVVLKRCATEYVLARLVNGELVEAQFDRDDKDFCYNPRITATGMYDENRF